MVSIAQKFRTLERMPSPTRSDFQALFGSRPSFSPQSVSVGKFHSKRLPPPPAPPCFTPEQAELIRQRYRQSRESYSLLSKEYGCAKSTICHVIARKGAYRANFARDF